MASSSSTGVGIGGGGIDVSRLWEGLNSVRKDFLILREELNVVKGDFVLLRPLSDDPEKQRVAEDIIRRFKSLERRHGEMVEHIDAMDNVMIEVERKLDEMIHGEEEEELELKKGVEEILEALEEMKV